MCARVNIKREEGAPIVQGEPIEEEGPPSPLEEASPLPKVPQALRTLADTGRPVGDLPIGQEAREPERGRGEASEGSEASEASERGERRDWRMFTRGRSVSTGS